MRNLRIIIFMLFSLFISRGIFAQSVDSLVKEASENNPLLKGMKQKIRQAEYKTESTGYLPPPSIGLEFSQVPFTDPNPLNNAISQNLSISQMFMLGGKLGAMYDAEKQNVPIAENEYHETMVKILASVREQYYKIWMDEHHLSLRDDLSKILNDLYVSAENSYKVNRSRYSDLLLIKSEIASNKTQVITLENDLKSEVYKMNQLLGRSLDDSSLVVQHNWKIDSLSINENELIDHLLEHNPSLAKMRNMKKMNELEVKANNKELIPDLMLQGMVMRMPRGMILTTKTDPMMRLEMGETEYMYSIMASVTLPFLPWSSGKISNRNQELSAGIESIDLQRTDMEREMTAQMKGIIRKIQSKRAQISLYEKDVIPLYNQTLDAQLNEFTNNQITVSPVLETYKTLLMKEEELAEIKMEHQMLMADIDMMLGNGVTK